MVGLRSRARLETRDGTATDETGGMAEDVAEDIEEGEVEEPTSVSDLTTEADVEQFDRTFTDDGASLVLEGGFDPVAGPKQVLPRIGYTINFNFVWNAARGRWEPDEGNEGGAVAGGTRAFQASGTGQTVAPNSSTIVQLSSTNYDTLGAGNVSGNELVAQEDGLHLLFGVVVLDMTNDGAEFRGRLEVNGSPVANARARTIEGSTSVGGLSANVQDVRQLSSGDSLQLETSHDSGTTRSIIGGDANTFLGMVQLT